MPRLKDTVDLPRFKDIVKLRKYLNWYWLDHMMVFLRFPWGFLRVCGGFGGYGDSCDCVGVCIGGCGDGNCSRWVLVGVVYF